MDDPERPERLLAFVLSRVQGLALPAAAALHPAFCQALAAAVPGQDSWIPPPAAAAWARGLAECAAAHPLRAHLLPRLGPGSSASTWLHLADEAINFDRALLRLAGDDRDCVGVCAPVLASRPEWAASWLQAELAHWLRRLDEVVDAAHAYEPLAEPGDASASPAPRCAADVVRLVWAAASRGRGLPPALRRDFIRAVPSEIARDFCGRLERRSSAGFNLRTLAAAARYVRRALLEASEEPLFLCCDGEEEILPMQAFADLLNGLPETGAPPPPPPPLRVVEDGLFWLFMQFGHLASREARPSLERGCTRD